MAECSIKLSGIGSQCNDNSGGIKEVYIAPFYDVASITPTKNAETSLFDGVSAITMVTEKKYQVFRFKQNTATLIDTATIANGSITVQHDLVMEFSKQNTAKQLNIQALLLGDTRVVVRTANDEFLVMGIGNPIMATAGSGESGAASGDFAGFKITLTEFSPYIRPLAFDPTAVKAWIDASVDTTVNKTLPFDEFEVV